MKPDAKNVFHLAPLLLLIIAALLVIPHLLRRDDPSDEPPEATDSSGPPPDDAWGGSAECRDCHQRVWEAWSGSHHALAEREFDRAIFGDAFRGPEDGEHRVVHGSIPSVIRQRGGLCEIQTIGSDGRQEVYRPVRIIGVEPLWQAVVATSGGRYQVTSLAYDPAREEWFDVYGEEDRQPHEWGFWTSRGMTWNTMCATCHTTRYRKGYDPDADIYDSEYLELGVGCEACHGPYGEHARTHREEGNLDPNGEDGSETLILPEFERPPRDPARPYTPEELRYPGLLFSPLLDMCGSCHCRRSELSEGFQPGARFLDHFRPTIVDVTDTYYPDGQVRDEDFEFSSFLSSRMYMEGVRCIHCHDPHTGEIREQDNALCLQCHEGRLPEGHSFHSSEGTGDLCVNCHMPLTTYMMRHPRRDHGFTIPDPLLTREFGIPNACNRCHSDQTVDWAIEAVEGWYGPRMDRSTRQRARTIARARAMEPAAIPGLLRLTRDDPSPFWRAVASGMLGPWAGIDPRVAPRLLELIDSPWALVRASAARSLDPIVSSVAGPVALSDRRLAPFVSALRSRLDDPVRLVRLEAAWALRRIPSASPSGARRSEAWLVSAQTRAGAELESYLRHGSDQPSGVVQLAVLALSRDDPEIAVQRMEIAASWDSGSAEVRRRLALAQVARGDYREAARSLEAASRLAPRDPQIAFDLGLLLQEIGRPREAERWLETACGLDERFTDAWIHLARLRFAAERSAEALEAIARAEQVDPGNPTVLEIRAGIHDRRGEVGLAQEYFARAREAREEMMARQGE